MKLCQNVEEDAPQVTPPWRKRKHVDDDDTAIDEDQEAEALFQASDEEDLGTEGKHETDAEDRGADVESNRDLDLDVKPCDGTDEENRADEKPAEDDVGEAKPEP